MHPNGQRQAGIMIGQMRVFASKRHDRKCFVLPSLNLEKFCKSYGTANFEHISKMNKIFKDIFSFRINIISIDIKRDHQK